MRFSTILRIPEGRSGGLLTAVALSFCIKAALLALLAGEAVNRDGVIYITAAQHFARGAFGQALEIFPLPLFPLAIAGLHLVVGEWLLAARLVSFLALLASLPPLYLITRDLFGPRAAFLAALAAALAPYPNEFVIAANRGALYLCLLAWGVYFAQQAAAAPRATAFLGAALFCGGAALCRKEGAVVVAICTLFFVFCLLRADRSERRAFLLGVAVWAAVFLVPAAVAAALSGAGAALQEYRALFAGEVDSILRLGFLDNYRQLYAQLKLLGQASPYPSGGQNFAEIARHYIAVIYLLGLFETLVAVLFPPFFIALLAGLRHRPTLPGGLILTVVVFYLLAIYYSHLSRDFLQSRFLLAPAFLLYPWVGSGLERIWARWCAGGRAKWRPVLFVGVFFATALVDTAGMVADRDATLAQAGRWVKEDAALRGVRLFFDDSRTAFHAGRSWQEFGRHYRLWREAGTAIGDFARAHGFEGLVLLSRSGDKKKATAVTPPFVRRKVFEGRRYTVEVFTLAGGGEPRGAGAGGAPAGP